MNYPRIGLASLVIAAPISVQAQTVADAPVADGGPAVGVDLFHSSDADKTEVTALVSISICRTVDPTSTAAFGWKRPGTIPWDRAGRIVPVCSCGLPTALPTINGA
jgi:hypothetical protein